MAMVYAHQIAVEDDRDVVGLRQYIRQVGRTVGLSLIQQAKITTAISTIARTLLVRQRQVVFTVQADDGAQRRSFAVSCAAAELGQNEQIDQTFDLTTARMLVDEADWVLVDHAVQLTLRMWL